MGPSIEELVGRHAELVARGEHALARSLATAAAGDRELSRLLALSAQLGDALAPVPLDASFRDALGRGLAGAAGHMPRRTLPSVRLPARVARLAARMPRPANEPAGRRRAGGLLVRTAAAAVIGIAAVWLWERGVRPLA
jgi:hypothetical protein